MSRTSGLSRHEGAGAKGRVFVSGLASRSGTTLLQLVLSSHPLVNISPETHSIQHCLAMMDKESLAVDLEAMLDFARQDRKFNSWPGFEFKDFAEGFGSRKSVPAREFIDAMLVTHDRNFGRNSCILGNKKGLYATPFAHDVKRLYPEARFIFIYRDPRDMVHSILANLDHRELDHLLPEISGRHDHIREIVRRYPDDCLCLRYEDLVASPERQCSELCEFLGVPFDGDMLRFHEKNRQGGMLGGSTASLHARTRTPFDPGRIQAWKSHMSPDLAETIEKVLGRVVDEYGYGRGKSEVAQW